MLKNKKISFLFIDILCILLSYFIGICFRYKFINVEINDIFLMYKNNIIKILFSSFIYILFLNIFKQYKNSWKLITIDDIIRQIISILISSVIILVVSLIDVNRIR